MPLTVSLAEAKNRLTELIRRTETGEHVIILKRHKPVARLLSETEYEQLQKRLAVAGLRVLRKRWEAAGLKAADFHQTSRRLLEERSKGKQQ